MSRSRKTPHPWRCELHEWGRRFTARAGNKSLVVDATDHDDREETASISIVSIAWLHPLEGPALARKLRSLLEWLSGDGR